MNRFSLLTPVGAAKAGTDLLYAHGLADIQLPFSLEGIQVPELSRVGGRSDGVPPGCVHGDGAH